MSVRVSRLLLHSEGGVEMTADYGPPEYYVMMRDFPAAERIEEMTLLPG